MWGSGLWAGLCGVRPGERGSGASTRVGPERTGPRGGQRARLREGLDLVASGAGDLASGRIVQRWVTGWGLSEVRPAQAGATAGDLGPSRGLVLARGTREQESRWGLGWVRGTGQSTGGSVRAGCLVRPGLQKGQGWTCGEGRDTAVREGAAEGKGSDSLAGGHGGAEGGQQEDEGAPAWRDRQGWAWGLSKREGQGGRRGRHSRRGHRVALWEDPSRSPPQPSPLALGPLPRVRLPAGA